MTSSFQFHDLNPNFKELASKITSIGLGWHEEAIIQNSIENKKYIDKSIRDLSKPVGDKSKSAIIISAGPSLYKNNILERLKTEKYRGTVIAIDGSFVRCIKAGIDPDYTITLDPHPTRMVRWFGDPNLEKNLEGDDYFSRQDLDITFRNNSIEANRQNIELVNHYGKNKKLIICSTSPKNLVKRVKDVGFDLFWWAPLVDSPDNDQGLTRRIVGDTGLPAMNTGGTVGTAAWIFALTVLKIPRIAVVGMDLGYYKSDTSYFQTQTYHSLRGMVGEEDINAYFPEITYPGQTEAFYTDPTYYWYRQNMLDLISASGTKVFNCTGGGTLIGPGVECLELEKFCKKFI